jgi:hypothetical protein
LRFAANLNLVALGTMPNSIGFMWLDIVTVWSFCYDLVEDLSAHNLFLLGCSQDYGLSYGRLVNSLGQVVEATVSSARLGLMQNVATPFIYNGGSTDVSNR